MDHALLFPASQIQKEHLIEYLLVCFIVVLMVWFHNPKLLKQYKTDLEQYPLAPTSTADRSRLEPLFSITLFSGKYLLTSALCEASIFSSHGHVSSMRITLFSLLEKIVMAGLKSVNAMWGGKEEVPCRCPNKTQSDAWCNIPLGEEFLFFTLVPFFTNFIFIGYFGVGTEDLMFLTEDLILLMIILRTLSWRKENLPWLRATLHAQRMWEVVHVSLLHRKQEASVVRFHLLRLLGEGKVS